jgi:tetratricopeptide repeat protein 8
MSNGRPQPGLYRDAEKQLRSSLKTQEMLSTYLELVKVYLRLDLPNSALEVLKEALRYIMASGVLHKECGRPGQAPRLTESPHVVRCRGRYEDDTRLLLGMARVYEMVRDDENALRFYKRVRTRQSTAVSFAGPRDLTRSLCHLQVLMLDPSNVEAIACLAAQYFYTDQVSMSMHAAVDAAAARSGTG